MNTKQHVLVLLQRCRRTGIIRNIISFKPKNRQQANDMHAALYSNPDSKFTLEVAETYDQRLGVTFFDETGVLIHRRAINTRSLPHEYKAVHFNGKICIIDWLRMTIVHSYPTIECYQRRMDAKYLLPE